MVSDEGAASVPLKRGSSPIDFGQVIGSLPLKLACPNSSCPSAAPPDWPGYQAITIAGTIGSHAETSMTLPPSSTTTIGFSSAATCEMKSFCRVPPVFPSSARLASRSESSGLMV